MYNEMEGMVEMEFILNPDIAYLLLVVGFLIATLALVTPGTGILELVAFFILALAGWITAQLNFNWVALIILGVGVFPFLLALRKTQKILFLFLSLAALSIGSTFLFVENGWKPVVHPVLAILINALAILFFWIVIRKGLEAIQAVPAHKLGTMAGEIGETRTEVFREGSVYARGEMWSASSDAPIPAFTKVEVIERDGFSLKIKPADDKPAK
jgi:membrane-bound serine protease (ClpP class)